MFSILISNYEHSEKELHNENCLLRQTLYDIYKEIELILGVEEDEKEFDPNNVEEVTNILVQNEYIKPEDAQFKLPLSISREYLGQRINDLLEQFKEYIFSIQDDVNDQEQEETSIDNNEMVNKTKEDSIMQIDEEYNNSKSDTKDRKSVYEELEEEYLKIEKQKEQLESEKKKFTEAAVRMGKERALLAQEKESLENEKRKLEEEKNKTRVNSINSDISKTPINDPSIKSFSYSLNSNLSTPIPTKFSPNLNNLNKNSYIDSSFNTTSSIRLSESPLSQSLSQSLSSNTPVMLNTATKSSRSIKNINSQDEFLVRNKEKEDISAFINQALERINKNKQSFLSLSKTYSLKNNSEMNKS